MIFEEQKKYMRGKDLLKNNKSDIKRFSKDDIEAIKFYIVEELNNIADDPEQLFDTTKKDLFKGVQDFLIYENVIRPKRSTGVKIYDSNCVGAVVGYIFEEFLLKNRLTAFRGSNGLIEFQKNNDVNVYDIDVKLTNTNLQLDIKTKLVPIKPKTLPTKGTVALSNYQFIMYANKIIKGKVEDVWIMSRYHYGRDYNGIVFMSIKQLLEYIDIVDKKNNVLKLKDNLGDKIKYRIDSKYNCIEVTNNMIYYNEVLSDITSIDEFYSFLMDNY